MRYNNVKWYPFLIPRDGAVSLLDEHPLSQLGGGKLVVQWETPPLSPVFRGISRAFAVFDFYTDFYRFQQQLAPENRCFYEMILGEQAQKPHFDIDLPVTTTEEHATRDGGRLVRALIRACASVFSEHGRTLDLSRDLCVYTSHGVGKRSYHLVVNHHCHSDNSEARALYDAVVARVDDPNRGAIDHAVYSGKQLFRIVGSTKRGKDRVKRFVEEFELDGVTVRHAYDDPAHLPISILYESLVTMTVDCIYFPRLVKPRERSLLELEDLSEEDAATFLQMVQETPARGDYSMANISGHILNLRRNRPSLCPVCDRTHGAENPYMFAVGDKVYWNCRRSEDGRSFLVGRTTLSPAEEPAPAPATRQSPPRPAKTQVMQRLGHLRQQCAGGIKSVIASPDPPVQLMSSRAGMMPRAVPKRKSDSKTPFSGVKQ